MAWRPPSPVRTRRSSRSGTQTAWGCFPLPYSTPGMKPSRRKRRASADPRRSRSLTCNLTRSPAISGGEVYRLLLDVQVDPEQDQRPEEDGEDRREDTPPAVHMLEVVMGRCDRDPDSDVDDPKQTGPSPHAGVLTGTRFVKRTRAPG